MCVREIEKLIQPAHLGASAKVKKTASRLIQKVRIHAHMSFGFPILAGVYNAV